ncbi:cytochrome b/b6 domain-containing protein [Acidovorax sp. DW039]|uniref:cytochrome b/b6 domain-containing protein n=1 Tax=Acidovorax sp. DW039 TaxID=3095606 RepID=UPI00308FE8D3|nr:cytochrome b/b6 domain-containing protein [Acidovorax sp. DW039]
MPHHTIRIWDLPTRLFHWLLAACIVGLVVTAKVGGNAMVWHFRLGYVVLALVVFRLVWGVIGGRWSRFASFVPTPGRLLGYLRGDTRPQDKAGHNPLGALSVLALLGVTAAQVSSGLFTDDEIAFAGPLTRFVSGELVSQFTTYHKAIGQYLLLGLVALHLLAIAFYAVVKKERLVGPMLEGDKQLEASVEPSRDGVAQRGLALAVALACAALAWWVSSLGA